MEESQIRLDPSNGSVLDQLAHQGILMAVEAQPRFDERFGGRRAQVDLAADRPLFLLSTPEANLEFGAQLVGTTDTASGVWSWGWREDQGFNPWTVGASRHLLSVGEATDDPDILLGSFPLQADAEAICIAATQAVSGLYVTFWHEVGGRRHTLLIGNAQLFSLPEPTPSDVADVVRRGAALPWVHDVRLAVEAYGARREGVEWEEDEIGIAYLRMDRGSVRIGFDQSGGVLSMEVDDAGSWLPAPADDGVASSSSLRTGVPGRSAPGPSAPPGSPFGPPPDAAAGAPPIYGARPRGQAGRTVDGSLFARPREGAASSIQDLPGTRPGVARPPLLSPEPSPEELRDSESELRDRQALACSTFDATHAGRGWRLSLSQDGARLDYLNARAEATEAFRAHLLGVLPRGAERGWVWADAWPGLPAAATRRATGVREACEDLPPVHDATTVASAGATTAGRAAAGPAEGEPHLTAAVHAHARLHGPSPVLRGRLADGTRFWAVVVPLG